MSNNCTLNPLKIQVMKQLHHFVLEDIQTLSDPKQIHQITRVLRLKESDCIVGIYNRQHILLRLVQISPRSIVLEVVEDITPQGRELPYQLRLYLPLIKFENLELIFQKCTELGVTGFYLIHYEHSQKSTIPQSKLSRWQKIIIEAVEQSERLIVPNIQVSLSQGVTDILSSNVQDINVSFLERYTQKQTNIGRENQDINCYIGPEGGFSSAEIEILQQQTVSISLSQTVLRTETAAIAGVSLMRSQLAFV